MLDSNDESHHRSIMAASEPTASDRYSNIKMWLILEEVKDLGVRLYGADPLLC